MTRVVATANLDFGQIHPSLHNEVVERPFLQQVTGDLLKSRASSRTPLARYLFSRRRLSVAETILGRRIRERSRQLTPKLPKVAADLSHVHAGRFGDLAYRHSAD